MRVFIGGVMQGSRRDRFIDDQDYRRLIAAAIQNQRDDVEILDPNELHPGGVDYGDEQAKATLLAMAELAGQADLVVTYLPQASMGSALEMCYAFRRDVPIVSISPMSANWVVKHLSSVVVPDLEAFVAWLAGGGLDNLVDLD